MSYQTLILFPSQKTARQWSQLIKHEWLITHFERAWVFEEDQYLQRYYRLAENAQSLFLISYAMDGTHVREWLEHCQASHLKAQCWFFETSVSLQYEWWPAGWREQVFWHGIHGRRLVMIGFEEAEKKQWIQFCALEQVRLLWLTQENYQFEKERYQQGDLVMLADGQAKSRALALIYGRGPTFLEPLMVGSKSVFATRAVSKWRSWWAIFRFRSRWF